MATQSGPVGSADNIKRHIEQEREVLGENIQDLQGRVEGYQQRFRDATDWRLWLERKPLIAVGAAFGSGLLLSLISRK